MRLIPPPRRVLAAVALLVVGLALASLLCGGIAMLEIRAGVDEVRAAAGSGAPAARLRAASAHFFRAGAALDLLAGPAWVMGHLPTGPAVVRQSARLLRAARDGSHAAALLTVAAADLLDTAPGPAGGVERWGPGLVAGLRRQQDTLAASSRDLAALGRALGATGDDDVPAAARGTLAAVRRFLPALEAGVLLLRAAPDLLGGDGPRRYLVVTQNSMELRPTGGFIGACGLLVLARGRARLGDFRSAYDVDWSLPAGAAGWPPLPLAVYEHLSHATFRDANWSPSFPVAARALETAYRRGLGTVPDGVVAVNTGALAALLAVLGRLPVPGYPAALDAATAVHTIDYYSNDHVAGHAKVYLGRAAASLVARLVHASRRDLLRLAPVVARLLLDRDVQIYLDDPSAESALARGALDGAAGASSVSATDYLAVVDANVGHSKVNDRIEQQISYRVDLPVRGAWAAATLRIAYANLATRHTLPLYDGAPLYQDFQRVLVPRGSRLLSVTGLDQPWAPAEEEGSAALGGYLALGGAARRTVTYDYATALPARWTPGQGYTLAVRQQSGAGPRHLAVVVTWHGRTVLTWSGSLGRDLVLRASFGVPAR